MKRYALVVFAIVLGCAKPPVRPGTHDGATIRKLEALGLLMKNEINPAFSKLAFLLAHAETEDPQAVRVELSTAGTTLRSAIGKLKMWHEVPTESAQGRDVFLTYAASIDGLTGKLMDSIGQNDRPKALNQLEEIADTCNNCHHFFRLKLEDSVVMRNVPVEAGADSIR
jgi:hypothetical protein